MTNKKMIAGLLLGGVAYWLFDSATDVFIFQEGTFRARTFSPPPHEIVMRSIIIALLAVTAYVVLISTREKKTQSDLSEKEKLLSESQRIAHIGSWAWEIEARTMTWTEETYRIYGRSPETFVLSPESFLGLLHPDDRAAMQEWIRACLAGEATGDLDFRTILPDGGVRALNGRGNLERDAENRPVRMFGTVQDITEAKLARDLLRQSEEKYRNVVERAHDGIIIVQDGIIKFANARMAELDGSSVEELTGTPYTAHVHPSELLRLMDIYRRRMAGEDLPGIYETILLRKDGSAAPSELNAGVITYEGRPADMVIVRDITDRKRAEEALKESELRFSSLMQTASDGVIMSDAAGAILTWNTGAERIFGYTNREALGKPLTMLMPERYRNDHLKGLERVSASGTSRYLGRIMDFHGIRKDGSEFPLELSVTSWITQKEVLFLGIIRDLTEHRKLEDQLRQAQKMEAIGQLAGGVAHDFNNILSAIIGYGSLAEMKLPEDHPAKFDLEQIHQSAARATALTQSLLTFSRKQPIKRELLELNEVIGTFEKFLLRLLREDIEMKTRLSGDELLINADRGQIEQVVMNLVTNARDAMPNKGVLTLEAKPVTLDESFVHAHGYGKPGEYVMLSVSDTGMGMDEETKRRIFEPFFTTKE